MSNNDAIRASAGQGDQGDSTEAVFGAFAPLPKDTETEATVPGPKVPINYHLAEEGANIRLAIMGICGGDATADKACTIAEKAIKKVRAMAPPGTEPEVVRALRIRAKNGKIVGLVDCYVTAWAERKLRNFKLLIFYQGVAKVRIEEWLAVPESVGFPLMIFQQYAALMERAMYNSIGNALLSYETDTMQFRKNGVPEGHWIYSFHCLEADIITNMKRFMPPAERVWFTINVPPARSGASEGGGEEDEFDAEPEKLQFRIEKLPVPREISAGGLYSIASFKGCGTRPELSCTFGGGTAQCTGGTWGRWRTRRCSQAWARHWPTTRTRSRGRPRGRP